MSLERPDRKRSWHFTMKAHSTTRFCFCASNLTSTLVLATIFATLRTLAIFLVWYQIRPDINQTESKSYTVFENHRKKYHLTLRAKRAFHFEYFLQNMKIGKNEIFSTVFENHRKKSHSTLQAKNGRFWRVFFFLKIWGLRSDSVTRLVSFDNTKTLHDEILSFKVQAEMQFFSFPECQWFLSSHDQTNSLYP